MTTVRPILKQPRATDNLHCEKSPYKIDYAMEISFPLSALIFHARDVDFQWTVSLLEHDNCHSQTPQHQLVIWKHIGSYKLRTPASANRLGNRERTVS